MPLAKVPDNLRSAIGGPRPVMMFTLPAAPEPPATQPASKPADKTPKAGKDAGSDTGTGGAP